MIFNADNYKKVEGNKNNGEGNDDNKVDNDDVSRPGWKPSGSYSWRTAAASSSPARWCLPGKEACQHWCLL